jgi:hypothetical protein
MLCEPYGYWLAEHALNYSELMGIILIKKSMVTLVLMAAEIIDFYNGFFN